MLAMKAVKGGGWLVFSRFLGRAIDLLTLLVLARILTPADFGIAAIATSLVAIVDTVLELPVMQLLMRLREVDKSHVDTGFTLSFLRSALIAMLFIVTAHPLSQLYGDPRLAPVLMTMAIGPIAKGLASPNMVAFGRELSFQPIFAGEFVAKLTGAAFAIATVFLGGGYWAIVVNSVAASVAGVIASYVLAPYRPHLSLAKFGDFSGFIGWFSGSQILSAFIWQFDRILLGKFVDKATLGQYTLASDLSNFPAQSLIGPATQPLIVAFAKISLDPERLRIAFLKATRFAMLISAPICMGISQTADLSVALLLGPQWHDAAPLLQILAPTFLAIPYNQTLSAFSLAVNKPVIVFYVNVIDIVARIILIPLGLYLYSVHGVTAARGLIAAIMFVVYLIYSRRVSGISVADQLKNLWKIAVALAAMAATVFIFRGSVGPLHLNIFVELVSTALIGASVYIGVLYACGLRLAAGKNHLQLVDV
ncbi:lipopolysaccharide biosynthesis protein [Hyphomicrobium sp. 99]|uniref:lipopolysaccharide biosynthesis protein n=1 Tax=Hyphomicrobium sp. 99 TaxID=1163419 RepID=UPI0005F84AB9|nr:lipopolysaccharide biosynthesis protein [Hyphomicrobium sp. 99]